MYFIQAIEMYKIFSYFLFLCFPGVIMSSYEKPLHYAVGGTTPSINAINNALFKLQLTAVPTDVPELLLAFGVLAEKFAKLEIENLKISSLLTASSWTDEIEGTLYSEYNFPSKEDILKILLDPNSKDKFLMNIDHQAQYNSPNSTSKKKALLRLDSLNEFTNIHTLRWLYYLMFCDSYFADKIRNILNTKNISVLEFCRTVGILHDKISSPIRNYLSVLSGRQIVDAGLMLNGLDIDKMAISNYVRVMIEIKRGFRLFEGTFTPLPSNELI